MIADFDARNFERLETFAEIARKTGRKIVVTPKDAYFLYSISLTEGNCVIDNDQALIYHVLKGKDKPWEGSVRWKWGEYYVAPDEISENPDKYIMCFSFYDLKHLLDIKPIGGHYIYSSSEAFEEEQEFEFARLSNWLEHFQMEIHGFRMVCDGEEVRPEFVKGFHASGHISEKDLAKVIDELNPDLIVPVHTEQPEWFSKNYDHVLLPQEGKRYSL